MEADFRLQVANARPEDSGRGLAHMPRSLLARLGIVEGDVVLIEGKRATPALAVIPYPEDEGLEILRIDSLQRANAGVGNGDFVAISKAESTPAKRVVFAPAQQNLRLQGNPASLRNVFRSRPLLQGDVVATAGQQRADVPPETAKFLNAPAYALQEIRLTLISTVPSGVVVHIDEDTEIELRPEYVDTLRDSRPDAPRTLYNLLPELVDPQATGRQISRFHADLADAGEVEDLIGISGEVGAFANLVLSKKVEPPLSIGVFGEWGAGKSFFMESVRHAVDSLASKPDAEDLHTKVVQIRFNAWHYIETNLWASLVEFIFSELDAYLRANNVKPEAADALFEQLCTAQELKLEAARELIRARTGLTSAEEALTRARADYRGAILRRAAAAVQALLDDPEKKKLEKAAARLGYDDAEKAAGELLEVLDSADDVSTRLRLVGQSLMLSLGSRPAVLVLAAAVLGLPFAVQALLAWLQSGAGTSWVQRINGNVLAIAAAATGFAGTAAIYVRKAAEAVGQVEKFRDRLATHLSAAADKDPVRAAERELQDLQQAVREAESRLAQASEDAASAAQAYTGETARGRLNRFIKDRVAEGGYARHLGMVAAIRRDFGLLSDLMRADTGTRDARASQLHEAQSAKIGQVIDTAGDALTDAEKAELQPPNPAPPAYFSRIILYIDDLDRCPPAKVVEVLQAIHMLLYFPLFVVFAAVDARWVARALQTEFPMLLARESSLVEDGASQISPSPAGSDGLAARAEHYLEKIFQIPFWVRPMTDDISSKFVEELAREAVTVGAGADEAVQLTEQRVAEAQVTLAPISTQPDNIEAATDAAQRMQIAITQNELEYLSRFARVVGTSPRRLKAYVNRYFLIRTAYFSALREEVPAAISCAAAALLAAVTGAPRSARALLQRIAEPDFTSVADLAPDLIPSENPEERARLKALLELLEEFEASQPAEDAQIADLAGSLRMMAGPVQRYSFAAM